jgi:single-strand DNA-binding protein
MANLNKVFLIGRLTRDPELRYTQNGTAVVEFGLAVNRNYTTADGQKKEDTCFVTVIMWQKKAEIISQYMRKGRQIFIEGRLELDTWQTPEGQKRSKLRVVGSNFQFLGPPPEGKAESSRGSRPQPEYNEEKYVGDPGINDDDVPF